MKSEFHDVCDAIGSHSTTWSAYWKFLQIHFWPMSKHITMSASTSLPTELTGPEGVSECEEPLLDLRFENQIKA